jgi:tRNA threonylcarbamoyladenosine biosynthesis protein TsaE
MKKVIPTSVAMKQLGVQFARRVSHTHPHAHTAQVIALSGDLGTGKTVFAQGFLKELGVRGRVTSPTFLIFRPYDISHRYYTCVYHSDLYRIESYRELTPLQFSDILHDPTAIVVVEWAEKIKNHIPRSARWIRFSHKSDTERVVEY